MKNMIALFVFIFSISVFAKAQGTLLVGNKEDNTLSFIELKQYTVVATIPVGAGPHEVAVTPSGKMAAVANYGDRSAAGHSVSVVDVQKKEVIKTIDLGAYLRPHGMEFINEEELLVTSEANKVLLRVNISSGAVGEVARTDQLTTHMVTYSPTDQRAYTSNINSGTVSVIDVKNNRLIQHINLKPGVEGLHVSPDGKELWVANQKENTNTVINTATFETVKVFPAQQVAYRVGFLPNGKYAAVSNGGAGNVSIYDAVAKKWITDIDMVTVPGTNPVPGGITASADNHLLFICTTGMNQVVVIDTNTWTIVKRIDTGRNPDGIYYSPVNVQ